MELSANQLYKSSKTNLSFKEWLKNNQKDGVLENHEEMLNADGNKEEATNNKINDSKSIFKMNNVNLIGLVGLGLLIYGMSLLNKVNVEE